MTDRALASIIIPTFNRSTLVRTAIDSALRQTIPCEVIVVDHGSSDDTPAVVASYGSRVRYLRRERDEGPLFAWLDGIVSATTEFVHITYDDDWIDDNFIEELHSRISPTCAYALSGALLHFDQIEPVWYCKNLFETGTHAVARIEHALLTLPLTISPVCALFRKCDAVAATFIAGVPTGAHFHRAAGPDLSMFLLPLLRYPSFAFVDKPLAHLRNHGDSITFNALADHNKHAALRAAYDDVKKFYLVVKDELRHHRGDALYRRAVWRTHSKQRMMRIMRGIGRRAKQLFNG